jgi:hypothetical protein
MKDEVNAAVLDDLGPEASLSPNVRFFHAAAVSQGACHERTPSQSTKGRDRSGENLVRDT